MIIKLEVIKRGDRLIIKDRKVFESLVEEEDLVMLYYIIYDYFYNTMIEKTMGMQFYEDFLQVTLLED